jgi:hypothetical protein
MGYFSRPELVERAARLERMRCLVQPAALWIGVVGALAHIAITAPASTSAVASEPGEPGAILSCPGSFDALQRECRRAGGSRCDVGDAIAPSLAIATAEEVLLGEHAADDVQLRFDPTSGVLVWTVHDVDAGTSIDLDAFTAEVVAFAR